jgi:hypothetical protein
MTGSVRPWAGPEGTMIPKRHHLLVVGLLLFLLGIQLRLVESFTLNERSSGFVAAQVGNGSARQAFWQQTPVRKVVEPPRWIGLAVMSVGAVLTIRGLGMKG